MPRGIPSTILDQLGSAAFSVHYLLRITLKSQTVYYCEGSADGTVFEGHAYAARLLEVSTLQYALSSSNQVNFKLANVDGAITTIDQVKSFIGAKFEVIEYFPDIAEGYVRWTGFGDELTERTIRYAIIPAYAGIATTRTDAPRRTIQTLCPWFFEGNNAAHNGTINNEGAECPYQRASTVGFKTVTTGAIDGSSDPVVVTVTALTGSRYFRNTDYFMIDSEIFRVISGGGSNSLACGRAEKGTSIASHLSGADVLWADCQKTVEACKDHGMYGNNASDQAAGLSSTNRNYYGGFPVISTQIRNLPSFGHFLQNRKQTTTDLAGNESAFGAVLPLVYGRCRMNKPILLVAKAEGDFLLTLWAVAEGVLGTNISDSTQTPGRLAAYATDSEGEIIFVNGARRHDPRANFGIQVWNGQQDQEPPAFAGVTSFTTDKLGLYSTAYVMLRISIKNNPTVDASSLQVNGDFEIRYGRCVKVYVNEAGDYTHKPTTNPAQVLADFATSRRGAVIDPDRFDLGDIVDLADYCDEIIPSVIDGSSVARWTFNGAIDRKRPVAEIMDAICQQMYALPPVMGIDGKYHVRALKAESTSGVPLFSSKAASGRQILWDQDGSRLKPFRTSLLKIPNEYRVNFVAYENSAWIRTQLVIGNEDAQKAVGQILGDTSAGVISESLDLMGVTTVDEAARIGTLHLRNGKLAKGGLSNNFGVKFPASYRDSAEVMIGDVIEVEDDQIDAVTQRYFRVIDIEDAMQRAEGGGFIIERLFTATLHDNDAYDDTALSVYQVTRLDPPSSYDVAAPAVTLFTVVEAGVVDSNNKLTTSLTFNYTEPSPLENFKSVVIFRSTDDGLGSPTGDWRFVAELFVTGTIVQYEVSGKTEHFCAVSRNIAGVTPNIDTLDAASAYKYPRYAILVDGVTDVLAAPANLTAFGHNESIALAWDAYTGASRTIFKRFNVYRGTTSDPTASSLIAQPDSNSYIDNSSTVAGNPSTVYYYFVKGVSKLEGAVVSGVTLTGLSDFSSEAHDNAGTDAATPSPAPVVAIIRQMASGNPQESTLTIGVTEGTPTPTNYDTVDRLTLQITTDATFATFPNDNCLDQEFRLGVPFIHEHKLNAPGVYSIRAKVTNIFGDSSWSSTATVTTDATSNISDDTGLADAPTVSLITNASNANVGGNISRVGYNIPAVNTRSLWGRNIMLHTSSTLPSNTTSDTGTAGVLVAGSNRFTDATKSWTPSQWVTGHTYDVIIFSPSRDGSPTWDNEGMWVYGNISGNGTNYLDIFIGGQAQPYKGTGLTYYIIRSDNNDSLFKKIVFASANEVDESIRGVVAGSSRQKDIPTANGAALYAFVALNTLFAGAGKLGTSGSATFSGLTDDELGTGAVTNTKIDFLAVTAAKISVLNLSSIHADLGTITAGTVTGATIQTSAGTGARVVLNSTGLHAYDSSNALVTEIINATGGGYIEAGYIQGKSSQLYLASGANLAELILKSNSAIDFKSAGSTVWTFGPGITDNGVGGDITLGGTLTCGTLKTGTHSAIGIKVVTGYITIKDSGGTNRDIAVVS